MKVVQVAPSVVVESSGPSYSVPALCQGLASAGCDVSLHILDDIPPHVAHAPYQTTTYPRHKSFPRNLGRSPEMLSGLMDVARTADILHGNGLWMMPNVYPAWVVRRLRRGKLNPRLKLVTSPRGALAPWSLAKGRWKKRIFGALLQYPALRRTDLFHATSEKEYEEIRAAGYRQPVAIVPIGMDVPEVESHVKEDTGRVRKLVFFGRLHKVKGVDRLIRAWGKVAHEGWGLVIAGPACGMLEEVKGIVAKGHVPRVLFVGESNGPAKYEFLAGGERDPARSDRRRFCRAFPQVQDP
ncbi:MAG: glycosyltransferase, partial [Bacteroidales bacterium]|nr:glycosyltransferase [Bacteroidales bacterium]